MNESTRIILWRALPVAAILVLAAAAAIVLDSQRKAPPGHPGPDAGPGDSADPDGEESSPRAPGLEGLSPGLAEGLAKARERLRAAGGSSPESVETLGRIVREAPEAVRCAVLLDLRPEFRLALHSRAAEAALQVLAILRSALASDPSARATVAAPSFRTVIQAALTHPRAAVRVRGVEILPRLETPLARRDAISALSDPDAAVRIAAIRAYVAFAEPPSPARICSMFASEDELPVRVALLKVLGSSGRALRRREVHETERRAFRLGTPAEKLQVMENVRLWRDHDLLPDLLEALRGPDAPVRQAVLETLLLLRDTRCREDVRAFAETTEDPRARDLAMRVLAAIGE